MAKSAVYKLGGTTPSFNMTPMIDCTFQLILFFLLTTQTASAEFEDVELPLPYKSVAQKEENPLLAIVNVVPFGDSKIREDAARAGKVDYFSLKGRRFERPNVTGLKNELVLLRHASGNPEKFVVELRADGRVHYNQIEPVMRALQEAGMGKLYITAKRESRLVGGG